MTHPTRPVLAAALRLPLLSTAALAVACGAAVPEAAEPTGDPHAPVNLYPMSLGTQWVYDIHVDATTPPILGIFEVVEEEGARRTVANNRGTRDAQVRYANPVLYEVTDAGIRHVSSGTWLLRAPIQEGATWPTRGGRTAEVTSTSARAEVVAGDFEGCVEIVETGDEVGRRFRTVYCPRVGPVVLETLMELELSMTPVRVVGRLRTHTPGDELDED